MSSNDGGPAFPRAPLGEDCERPYGHQDGMSLRDWFAGQSDVSVAYDLLHREGCEELIGEPMPEDMLGGVKWRLKVVAALRFLEADAMLAARNSTKPNGEPK